LNQYPEAETVTLVLGIPSIAPIFEGESQWPLARPYKIEVSGRLSGKTVLARVYFELVSARVGSCFSWSTRPTCGDGT
jgi:hypothetical protein